MTIQQLKNVYSRNYKEPVYLPYSQEVNEPDPTGYWEGVGTMLKYQYSPIINYIDSVGKFTDDPDFKAYKYIDFENEDASYLASAGSREELQFLRENKRKQQEIKQDIHHLQGSQMLIGAMLDPLNFLIPGAVVGKTVMQGVKTGAMAGLKYGVASEALRAPFDPTNTTTETLLNVGVSSTLGGAIGGAIKIPMATMRWQKAKKQLQETTDSTLPLGIDKTIKNKSINVNKFNKDNKTNIKEVKHTKKHTIQETQKTVKAIDEIVDEKGNSVFKLIDDAVVPDKAKVGDDITLLTIDSVNAKGKKIKGIIESISPQGMIKVKIGNKKFNAKTTLKKISYDMITRDKDNNIVLDTEFIKSTFKNKPWTNPKLKGVKPLPDNQFESANEWFNFVLLREYKYNQSPKKTNEAPIQYENRINQESLEELKTQQLKIKKNIPIKNQYDSALRNTLGNIVKSTYRKIIFYEGELNGKELPDSVKKLIHKGFGDGQLTTIENLFGIATQSTLQKLGQHLGKRGDFERAIENLHSLQLKLKKEGTLHKPVNKDIYDPATGEMKHTARRGYFGATNRIKWWQSRNDDDLETFINRVAIHYMLKDSWKQINKTGRLQKETGKDFNYLKYDPKTDHKNSMGKSEPITKVEEEATKVLEKYFKEYEGLGLDAGMFNISRTLQQKEYVLSKTLPDEIKEIKEKFKTTNDADERSMIGLEVREAEKRMFDLRKSIDDIKKHEKDLTPPFEENYYSRIYNKEFIKANREIFQELVEEWFKVKPYRLIHNEKTGLLKKISYSTDPKEITKRAKKHIVKLLEEDDPEVTSSLMNPLNVSALHGRNLDAPNYFGVQSKIDGEIYRLTDFIITDPFAVVQNYATRIAPKIQFKSDFGMSAEQVKKVIEKEMLLEKFTDKDIAKIKQGFDVLYSRVVGQTIKSPERWDNELAQYIKALGTITFLSDSGRASIVDTGNSVFQYGFRPWQMAMETFSRPELYGKRSKANRLAGEGIGTATLVSMANKVIEYATAHPATNRMARVRDRSVEYSMQLNFLKPFTLMWKEVIGNFSQHDIIEKSFNYNSLTKSERITFARHGIGEYEANLIQRENKAIEIDSNGAYLPNIDKWENSEAKTIFLATHQTYINTGSLTASASDKFQMVDGVVFVPYKPWMSKFKNRKGESLFEIDESISSGTAKYVRLQSGMMGLPFMFWNYGLAANQKILQAGFDPNRPLSNRLFGASIMIGLGYMIASWRVPDYRWDSMTYAQRMAKAVHLSGVTGMYTDILYMNLHMYKGFGGKDMENSLALYDPDIYDAIMEPFGAGYGYVGDVGRSLVTMATDSIPHGLAQLPYPLQFNMFLRDDIREMRRFLRNY
tara:strand:- start:210 stop:4271 length:4062 start_codon:yes stop_codon:yes gene_type:complete